VREAALKNLAQTIANNVITHVAAQLGMPPPGSGATGGEKAWDCVWRTCFVLGVTVVHEIQCKARGHAATQAAPIRELQEMAVAHVNAWFDGALCRCLWPADGKTTVINVQINVHAVCTLDVANAPLPIVAYRRLCKDGQQWFTLGCKQADAQAVADWLLAMNSSVVSKLWKSVVITEIIHDVRQIKFFTINSADAAATFARWASAHGPPLWARALVDPATGGRTKVTVFAITDQVAGQLPEVYGERNTTPEEIIGRLVIEKPGMVLPLQSQSYTVGGDSEPVPSAPPPPPPPPPQQSCKDGNSCARFHDRQHMSVFAHPHSGREVCSATPWRACTDRTEAHREQFVHVCREGSLCRRGMNEKHMAQFIHLRGDETCERGTDCQEKLAEHVVAKHGAVREVCGDAWCSNTDATHTADKLHGPPALKACTFDGLHTGVTFDDNVAQWSKALRNMFEKRNGWQIKGHESNVEEIRRWFEAQRVAHMCSGEVLASVARLAAVGSLGKLATLWKDVGGIADLVWLKRGMTEAVQGLSDADVS
jgi:hypothetical protein